MIKFSRFKIIPLILAAIMLYTACSSGKGTSENYDSVAPEAQYNRNAEGARLPADNGNYGYSDVLTEMGEISDDISGSTASDIQQEQREEKRIKKANFDMETNNFEEFIVNVKDATVSCGGYVENYSSSVYSSTKDRDFKYGDITIRVPSEKFDWATGMIETLAKVNSFSQSDVSVTDAYYDIEARMETTKIEEQRVQAMIEHAKDIKDLIALEEKLSSIREQIELYQSQLTWIDRKSSFSTINLSVREVEQDITIRPISENFSTRLLNSLKSSINATRIFFENIVILLAGVIVPLLAIGIVSGMIVLIVLRIVKIKEKRANNKKEDR